MNNYVGLDVILFSVIRSEHLKFVPHFIKYYRYLGVDIFSIVVQASNDDDMRQLISVLQDNRIEPEYFWYGKFSKELENKYLNDAIKKRCNKHFWVMRSDVRSFHEYPNGLKSFIEECEKNGFDYIVGEELSRCSEDGFPSEIDENISIFEQFPISSKSNINIFNEEFRLTNKLVLSRGRSLTYLLNHLIYNFQKMYLMNV